jgi:dTDP-4-amino-4,6-dideoxygalactose transaminase
VLHAENVLARRYFWPGCHRMEPYRTLFPNAYQQLPVTERVAERVLILPTGSATGDAEIDVIAAVLRAAVANAERIHQHLAHDG